MKEGRGKPISEGEVRRRAAEFGRTRRIPVYDEGDPGVTKLFSGTQIVQGAFIESLHTTRAALRKLSSAIQNGDRASIDEITKIAEEETAFRQRVVTSGILKPPPK